MLDLNTLGTRPPVLQFHILKLHVVLHLYVGGPPTVENGTGYSHKIYINGEYKTSYGSYETERTGFNFSVAEGEEHIRMVIARSYNGAETAQELTSFQEAYPITSDFEITRSDTTGT